MTFGYSSLLNDEKNTAGLSEWAHSLLQALSSTRKTEAVCALLQGMRGVLV